MTGGSALVLLLFWYLFIGAGFGLFMLAADVVTGGSVRRNGGNRVELFLFLLVAWPSFLAYLRSQR